MNGHGAEVHNLGDDQAIGFCPAEKVYIRSHDNVYHGFMGRTNFFFASDTFPVQGCITVKMHDLFGFPTIVVVGKCAEMLALPYWLPVRA